MRVRLRRLRRTPQRGTFFRMAGLVLAVVALALAARAGAAAVLVRPVRVEEGSMDDVVTGEGFVLRDEEAFFAPGGSQFKPLVQEGEKVRVGTLVMQGEETPMAAEIRAQLNSVQAELDRWRSDNQFKLSSASSQMHLVRERANSLMDQIVQSLRAGEPTRETELEMMLRDELADHAKLAAEYDQLLAAGLRLEEEKAKIERALDAAIPKLCATVSGIVSFKVDGLEGFLGKQPLSKLSPRALRAATAVVEQEERKTGFRIVKSLDVLVGVVCSVSDASRISRQSSAVIEIEGKSFKAKLREFSEQDPPGYVTAFFELPDAAQQLLYVRRSETRVILDRRVGGVVPRNCVFSRDGTTGVYVVRKSMARFQPVEVIGQPSPGKLLVANLSPGQYVVSFPWLAREGQVVR